MLALGIMLDIMIAVTCDFALEIMLNIMIEVTCDLELLRWKSLYLWNTELRTNDLIGSTAGDQRFPYRSSIRCLI